MRDEGEAGRPGATQTTKGREHCHREQRVFLTTTDSLRSHDSRACSVAGETIVKRKATAVSKVCSF